MAPYAVLRLCFGQGSARLVVLPLRPGDSALESVELLGTADGADEMVLVANFDLSDMPESVKGGQGFGPPPDPPIHVRANTEVVGIPNSRSIQPPTTIANAIDSSPPSAGGRDEYTPVVKELVQYWLQESGTPAAEIKPIRNNIRQKIRAVLKAGYTADDVRSVIDFVLNDNWHSTNNVIGLPYICKNTMKFADLLGRSKRRVSSGGGMVQRTEGSTDDKWAAAKL